MKIPKKIKVAGRTFDLEYKKDFAGKDGLAGQAKDCEQKIVLQNDFYHQEKVEQTFWHEIIHELDINYLNSKLTEDQVDALSTGLYAFLKDNKLIK